jgi:diguanylate cyclase (GGDEF)-like protein
MSAAAGQQVALMIAEALFVGVVLLAAFRLRGWFGPSLVYIIFGGIFQYANLLAGGVYTQLTPWLVVSPGSVVLFPAVLFLVLFVYLISDALDARKLIYGLAGANVLLLVLALFMAAQLQSPVAINPYHIAPQLFMLQPRIVAASAIVLFLDTLLVCLLYEFVSRYTRSVFLRIFFSLLATLYFDSIAFSAAAFAGEAAFPSILLSQLVGKTVAALIYSILLTAYLRYFGASEGMVAGDGRELRAMFRVLTYRQRYEELQRVVVRDALTNVYNRGFFEEAIENYVEIAKRSGRPLSMLMVDVDHFKRVNDVYGHAEGDRVLQRIATAIVSSVRVSDCVCRYGGEEFAVLLPQTDLADALVSAERIVADVPRACATGWLGANTTEITVTVGVAAFPLEAANATDLLRTADRRLYEGKEAGRNRAVGTDAPAPAALASP